MTGYLGIASLPSPNKSAFEVNGQRPDGSNTDRTWITYWHPLKGADEKVIGINVAAEEITDSRTLLIAGTGLSPTRSKNFWR